MNGFYLLLLIAIILTSLGQAALKVISMRHDGNLLDGLYDPYFYLVLLIYGIAVMSWFISASKIDYVVLIPANVATVVLGGIIGYWFFGETLGIRRIISYLLIISGVLLLFTENINHGYN